MTDTELFALAVLVQSSRLSMKSGDELRLSRGCEIIYGDIPAYGEPELTAELKRRGVLPGGNE